MNIGTARDLTKSDTPNDRFDMFMVTGTTGSVSYTQENGGIIELSAVPVGVWVPTGAATNILTASTALGLMVV